MSRRTVHAVLELAWSAAGGPWLASIVLAAGAGLAAPLTFWLSRALVDTLTSPRPDVSQAVVLAALTAGTAVLGSIISTTAGFVGFKAQQAISLEASRRLYGAVGGYRVMSHIEDPEFQNKLQLAEGAADEAPMRLSSTLIGIIQGTAMIAGVTGGLFAIWPPLPLIMLAVVAPVALAQRVVARKQADIFTETAPHHRSTYVFRNLITAQYGAKESRIFGLRDFLLGRMLQSRRTVADLELRAESTTIRAENVVAAGIGVITMAGAAYVGYLAATKQVSVGAFVFFTMSVAAVQGSAIGLLTQVSLLLGTFRLFRNYLDVVSLSGANRPGVLSSAGLTGRLEVDDVWFRYNESSDWALRGVSFTVEPGQTVGVVGLNGAGKSTIVKLICRLYELTCGSIRWDGLELADLDVNELMQKFTVTFQDYATYDLIAAECIGVGRLESLQDRDLIQSAAQMAEMDNVLSSLPSGYDTLLSQVFLDPSSGIVGSTLSGGQNQRIALARAFMRIDADLMILDEPSAGLDAEAEDRVYRRLREARQGKTTIIVTHRLNLLSDVDRVLVFEHGVIAESGTPRELLQLGGSYARLFAIQSAGFDSQVVALADVDAHPDHSSVA